MLQDPAGDPEVPEAGPQVRLIIRSRNCLDIAENVRSGACDLGVGYDMDWSRDMLEVEPMEEYEVILLASPEFCHPDFVTRGQRKPVSLVTDEPDSIFRRRLEAYLRARDITLDATLELWSIETIKRCVMSNLGFTYLPRFAAQEELKDGRLIELAAPISGVRFPPCAPGTKTAGSPRPWSCSSHCWGKTCPTADRTGGGRERCCRLCRGAPERRR